MPPNQSTEQRLAAIEARLARGDARMGRIETSIESNTAATLEVRDLLGTFKAGMRFLGWLGNGFKWLGALAAAIAAIWSVLDHYRLPK